MRSLIEDNDPEVIELAPNAISLDLLQAVYRSGSLPLHTRMRAAGMALPYECPKLIATAIINESSFAELLDRRIAKLQAMEQAKQIDAKPMIDSARGGGQQSETKPPLAHTPDRRFRRM